MEVVNEVSIKIAKAYEILKPYRHEGNGDFNDAIDLLSDALEILTKSM